jgi:hypothetical protein
LQGDQARRRRAHHLQEKPAPQAAARITNQWLVLLESISRATSA